MLSITEEHGHPLLRHRENPAMSVTRVPIVENAILFASNVLLQNHRERRVRQILVQLLHGTDDRHSRATLAGIRLQNDRELQALPPHEFPSLSKSVGSRSTC